MSGHSEKQFSGCHSACCGKMEFSWFFSVCYGVVADAECLTTPDGGAGPSSQVELLKSNVQHGVFNGSRKCHSADDDAGTEKANDTLPVEPLELETGVFQRKTRPGRSPR